MSKTIYDVSLIALVPPNLQNNADAIAIGKAIDKQWKNLANKIGQVLTYADIDNASAGIDSLGVYHASCDVVDMLAAEMNVDFYDRSFDVDVRKKLVEDAYVLKFTKGTKYAVRKLVTDAYKSATVEEWFDYDGKPYHFRVITGAALPNEDRINQIFKAIKVVKNARSVLDYLAAEKTLEDTISYIGLGLYQRHYQRIK